MTNPTVDVEDDLDLHPEDEAPIELTREQELSRLSLRELQLICKDPAYGLPANGKTTELIARIIKFEEEGIVDGDGPLELKPGIAPTPVEPFSVPASPNTPDTAAGAPSGVAASAPGDPGLRDRFAGLTRESARPQARAKQKTGFFEATNTYRAEFPLGPRAQIDDPTHFQFIEGTHEAARAAGYLTKGAPHAGHRVGFSVIRTESGSMRSVIYEVFARTQED